MALPRWVAALRERVSPAVAASVVVMAGVVATAASYHLQDDPGGGGRGPMPSEAGGGGPVTRRSFLEALIPPGPERTRGPRVARSVADLAARLPLERKVAQLFVWGLEGQRLDAQLFFDLRELDLGGVLLTQENYGGPGLLASLAGEALLISQQQEHVPPFVLAAQEGGAFNEFPDLPPGRAPGEYDSPAAAAAAARSSGRSLRALGVSGVLAPVADVRSADSAGPDARAFSDRPGRVAAFTREAVLAYTRARVFTAPKHFPGLGAASQPTEDGPATVGLALEELDARDLVPFRAAIRAGAPGIVLGHGTYASGDFVTPASLSEEIATGLLRERLRFRGVAIADDLASPAMTAVATIPDAAVQALRAGADMLIVSGPPGAQRRAYNAVLNAVRRRELSRRRLNRALLRVLQAKARFGLIR